MPGKSYATNEKLILRPVPGFPEILWKPLKSQNQCYGVNQELPVGLEFLIRGSKAFSRLAAHRQHTSPESRGGEPSWLTFLGQMKDSL